MIKSELVKKYDSFIRVNYKSKSTISAYLSCFFRFLQNNKVVEKLSSEELRYFLCSLIADDCYSDSYFNQMLACLKIVYGPNILNQPRKLKGIHFKKSKQNRWIVLTSDEVARMIMMTSNVKHKMIIKLLYVLGLRMSELQNLRLSDIDRANMQMIIRSGKGNKDRAIDIDKMLINQLEIYWRQYRPKVYVIESTNPGKRYSASSIRSILKKHQGRLGKKIWPHLLRHSIASAMINEGVNIIRLKQFLGHKDIRTTEYYYQYVKNDGLLSDAQLQVLKRA